MKVKCDHHSKFSNLSNWKEEAWKKIQGFNGIWTRDLRDTGSNPVEALIFFQAFSFQLLKLEYLLRWSLFIFTELSGQLGAD